MSFKHDPSLWGSAAGTDDVADLEDVRIGDSTFRSRALNYIALLERQLDRERSRRPIRTVRRIELAPPPPVAHQRAIRRLVEEYEKVTGVEIQLGDDGLPLEWPCGGLVARNPRDLPAMQLRRRPTGWIGRIWAWIRGLRHDTK